MRSSLLPWILGARGMRFVGSLLVALLWLAPATAIVVDSPACQGSDADSYYQTAWVSVLVLLAMTVLLTLILEDVLGHRHPISVVRCIPSAVAFVETATLAIRYPSSFVRSAGYALDVDTIAAILILTWAVRRWRRSRAVPIAAARIVTRTPR